MRYSIISSLMILFCALSISAQNRIFNNIDSLNSQALSNVSSLYFLGDNTRISLGHYNTLSSTLIQAQKGKNHYTSGLEVESIYTLSPTLKVWGYAHYLQNKTTEIIWNESSDIERIGPYAMADSIGGTRYAENYEFIGGFLQTKNKWLWGGEMSYTAQLSYGKIDPRPKNSTSNLRLESFAGYQIYSNYKLLIKGSYERYKQTNTLKYFNELGVYPSFHLTGIDTHYARFRGTNNTIFFEGNQYGLQCELFPQVKGIHLLMNYEKSYLDKILPAHNNIILNQLQNTRGELRALYTFNYLKQTIASQIGTYYQKSLGYTHLYGDAANNEFPFLLSNHEYTKKVQSLDAKLALSGPINTHWNYYIKGEYKYTHNQEIQHASQAYRNHKYGDYTSSAAVSWTHSSWKYVLNYAYHKHHVYYYDQQYSTSEVSGLLKYDSQYLNSNSTTHHIATAIHYKGYSFGEFILSASYNHTDYAQTLQNSNTQQMNLNLSLVF